MAALETRANQARRQAKLTAALDRLVDAGEHLIRTAGPTQAAVGPQETAFESLEKAIELGKRALRD